MNRALTVLSCLTLTTLVACGSSGDSGRVFSRNSPAAQMSFQNVNAMQNARAFHTATLLNDGRVLVVGGKTQSDVTPSAEIFDPTTGDWTAVGRLSTPRMNHAAALLPNGDVLIIGGQSDQNSQNALSSTEVFAVSSAQFTQGPNLSEARSCPTVIAFTDQNKEQLLIAGGSRLVGRTPLTLDSTDILDLSNLRVSTGPQMNARRMCSRAVNLGNGQIMIEGGWTGLNRPQGLTPVNPEVFDIGTRRFSAMTSPAPRADNTLTMLGSTPISIGGRLNTSTATSTVAKFENSQWANAQSTIVEARWSHRALDIGGEVMVIGGRDSSDALGSTELFSNSGVFAGPALVTARSAHTSTRLQNNRILVTGGENTGSIPLSATEILAPNGANVPGSTTVIPAPGQGSGTGSVTPGTGTAAPVIATISPSSGPVGTVVTLNGTGFSTTLSNNSAEIGGIPATVTNATATQLTIVVPNGATTGPVAIAVGAQGATGPVFTVTAGSGSTGPRPEILFIVPNNAQAFVPVAITGRNFGTSPRANFNGTPAISIISLKLVTLPFIGTVHELVTLVPPGATTGDLVVEANGQQSPGVPFTVN